MGAKFALCEIPCKSAIFGWLLINGEEFSSQCNVNVKAVDSDAKVVYVETAGTLSTLLTEDEKDNTTKLIVAGNLNSEDIKVLRYMAGRDENGNLTVGMLEDLDMSLSTGINYLSDDAYGFKNCNSLKKIILPKSITSLYHKAFYGCKNLEDVVLQEGLTSIGSYTFEDCSKLESINIPASVTNIEGCAFQECSSLKIISIPASVTSIGEAIFRSCTSLTSVTFEEGSKLTGISNSLFSSCRSLVSVNIPASMISIGEYAFYDCF